MQTQNCPACGGPLAVGSAECSYCGAQQAAAAQQSQPSQPSPGGASINIHMSPNNGMQFNAPPGPNGQVFTQPPPYQHPQQPPPHYYPPYGQQPPYAPYGYRKLKNKVLAGILAILLGGLGIHKFYLGKPIQGILYVLFCWTYIPAMIGFIEGIVYLCMNEQNFHAKYSKPF